MTKLCNTPQSEALDPPSFPKLKTPHPLSLTPKQLSFCEEYLLTSNATLAAIKAGYSKRSAHVTGPRLLGNAAIRTYLHAREAQLMQSRALSLEFVVAELLDTYRKAKEPVPIYNAAGLYTGEYTFDGQTAVACLMMLAKLKGMLGKQDGRSKRAFNISVLLAKHKPQTASDIAGHAGIPVPTKHKKIRLSSLH